MKSDLTSIVTTKLLQKKNVPSVLMSPENKVKRSKILFNKAFKKQPWSVHPSIIPFLTPMKLCEARLKDNEVENSLLLLTAPVNHNKLN
jgi:hypothetical protein